MFNILFLSFFQSRIEDVSEKLSSTQALEIGIPNVILDCSMDPHPSADKVCNQGKFPSRQEILDGLGIGDKGPPIPPSVTLSVVNYPSKRKPPPAEFDLHYTFVQIPGMQGSDMTLDAERGADSLNQTTAETPAAPSTPPKSRRETAKEKKEKEKEEKSGKQSKADKDKDKDGRRSKIILNISLLISLSGLYFAFCCFSNNSLKLTTNRHHHQSMIVIVLRLMIQVQIVAC